MSFNGAPDGNPHGGYSLAALNTYFEKVLGGTTPQITNVVVSGPGNDPGPDTSASDRQGDSTGEVMLDACVVGSVAPGAHIFMYFTEFTTQGWVDALQEAIAGDNDIAVISISYGNPEDDPQGAWTAAGVQTVNEAFQAAIAAGITICCASGDDGSSDGVASGAHVDFPASSRYVLGVGGTKLTASSLSPRRSRRKWRGMRWRRAPAPAAAVSPRYSPNRRGKTASTSLRQSIRHTRSAAASPTSPPTPILTAASWSCTSMASSSNRSEAPALQPRFGRRSLHA